MRLIELFREHPRTIGMYIDDKIMEKNLSARLILADKKYFKIGEVRKGKKINLKSNKGLSLKKFLGYDHFKII